MSYLKIRIDDNFSAALKKKLERAGPRAAHAVAVQIQKDTDPFVPASQEKSLATRTQVVENKVVYPGPYARYLYNGKVMVFKDQPYKIVRPDGKVVLTHFGHKKFPTEKPLKISKAVNPKATDHWLEASKAQNLEKWIRAAGKAVEHEFGE